MSIYPPPLNQPPAFVKGGLAGIASNFKCARHYVPQLLDYRPELLSLAPDGSV